MLKDILAISGQPGLYKLVSQTKNGVIVENIETNKRTPAYSSAKISALEDIAIYTQDGEDKPLGEVFNSIRTKEDSQAALSHKSSSNELKAYFAEIMPDYDEDRVYVSDIKKVLQWYNVLQANDMLSLLDETEEVEEAKTDENKDEAAE